MNLSLFQLIILVVTIHHGDCSFQLLAKKNGVITADEVEGLLIYKEALVCNQFSDDSATAVCKEMGYLVGSTYTLKDRMDWALPPQYNSNDTNPGEIICTEPNWSSCNYTETTHTKCGSNWYQVLRCSGRMASCSDSASSDSGTKTRSCKERNQPAGQVISICFSLLMVVICSILAFFLVKERKKTMYHRDIPGDIPATVAYDNRLGSIEVGLEGARRFQDSEIKSKYDDVLIITNPGGNTHEVCSNQYEVKDEQSVVMSKYEDLVITQTEAEEEEGENYSVLEERAPTCSAYYGGGKDHEDEAKGKYEELVITNPVSEEEGEGRYCVLGANESASPSKKDEAYDIYSKLNKK